MKKFGFPEESEEDNIPAPTRPLFQPTGRTSGREGQFNSKSNNSPPSSVAIEIPGFKSSPSEKSTATKIGSDSYEALQTWKEVTNLDRFLEQLYYYYNGKGLSVILISRISNLFTLGFVVSFTMFLRYCIDWSFLWKGATETEHPKLVDVIRLGNIFSMSFFMYLCSVAFLLIWSWQLYMLVHDIPRLKKMQTFFNKVLLVQDDELATFDFSEIVNKLIYLQSLYPIVSGSLDACEIANRIMRRENYLIALFNKEIVDLSIPLPIFSSQTLTKTLEWNLSFAILSFIFDENLVVKKAFLKDSNRRTMAEELQRRFQLLAIINLVLSPFIFMFLLIHFIFRYGEEAYKNPRIIGDRQYTPYARWKLREFNELPHYFDRRLSLSHKKALRYMEQFHSEKLAGFGKFIGFVAGSVCFVFLAMTVINEDLLMHFEITPGKSIIWYLAFFGAILAITRALVPDQHKSKDPAKLMMEIQEFTHYMPQHWKNQLHSEKIRNEFGQLYQYQFINFIQELFSVIWTPYLLWFRLPSKAENIVEFFREFTVHVDKLGYVCSFALFDFNRHGNPKYGSVIAKEGATGKYLHSKQGKMEKSFISFANNYPDWTPNQQGSIYISKLRDFEMNQSMMAPMKESRLLRPINSPMLRPFKSPEFDNNDSVEEHGGIMALLNEYCEYRRQNSSS